MASIGEARGNAPDARPVGIPGFALVAGAAALWGSDALFRRGLALELPAAAVVFVEHAILVALTAPLLLRGVRAARSFTARDWVALLVIGVGASATATILFTQAFTYGDPTTPLLLQKLQPLIAVVGPACCSESGSCRAMPSTSWLPSRARTSSASLTLSM